VDEDYASKIPEGLTDHDAATLPTNVIAALIALFDPSTLALPAPWAKHDVNFDFAGTTLLVMGGGSNCGRFGVQLAHLAGLRNIVVVGGDKTELKGYGASHVLDRHGGDEAVLKRIQDVVGDDLLYVYDAINPPQGQHVGISSLSSTRTGKLARLISSNGEIDQSKIVGQKEKGYELKNVFGISSLHPDTARPFWERVEGYLKDGSLVPLKYEAVEGLDVDAVNEVLDRYRDGKKVVQTHLRVSK
jgi:NADPH2:quinone reductase